MLAMPAVVVLIACKTVLSPVYGVAAENDRATGHESRVWAYENSKMKCRRYEIPVIDIDEFKGAKQMPFDPIRCRMAGVMLFPKWNEDHKGTAYRAWRFACPTKIVDIGPDKEPNTPDDKIIGWKLPECGHRDTVVCEQDTAI